jgi:ABC-type transport system involved in multi-copper enzyme maturation permease subunit
MNKVMKYKLNYLLSNKFLAIFIPILFVVLNFEIIINSGVLLSGGANFNSEIKYQLVLNNYIVVISFFGFLAAIFIGSSVLGPDIQTGNLYIILSIYPSRRKYYFGTFITCVIYLLAIQILLLINEMILIWIFDIQYLASDISFVFFQNLLNSIVALSLTSLASIYIKGHGSAFVGLLGYAFFSIYLFNIIPFINSNLVFDITQYKDILVNFFPIANIYGLSYTETWVSELYNAVPLFGNMWLYQFFYIAILSCLSAILFSKKDL